MRPTGRVVGILNRNWRSYVATIQEEDADTAGGSFHLAIPLDSVIPKIRIRHQNVKMIQNQRIVVRIDSWYVQRLDFFLQGRASISHKFSKACIITIS